MGETIKIADQDTWCGKTSTQHLTVQEEETKEKTSKSFSQKQFGSSNRKRPLFLCLTRENGPTPDASTLKWENGALLGEFATANFGEAPNVENVSRLSSILEDSPLPTYSLSETCCRGILKRAKAKGKILPPELEKVLTKQANLS